MVDRVNIMHDRIEPSKMRMLGDGILLEKLERDKIGSIVLAGSGLRTEHCYGRILKLGPGLLAESDGKRYPMDLEEGDTVLAMDYMGEKLQHRLDLTFFRIIRDHMVWAKVKLGKNLELQDIEPYSSKVLVRITENLVTEGGIQLPSAHQSRGYTMATVVKVGPGWRDLKTGYLYPMTVKPGDIVCMLRYAGSIVKLESDELRMIEERPYMDGDTHPDILYVHQDWKGWMKHD
jgi:co-chaperonin GroES (HSP10)